MSFSKVPAAMARSGAAAGVLTVVLSTAACSGPPPAEGNRLFSLDFQDASAGIVDEEKASAEWSNGNATLSSFNVSPRNSMRIDEEGGNRYLARAFEEGSFNAPTKADRNSAVIAWDLDGEYEAVHLSYRVRVSKSFEPGRGGKLPGLCGGSCPTGGDATDDDDGGALGWSARNMWLSSGGFSQYVYLPGQDSEYGEGLPYQRGDDTPRLADPGWQQVDFVVQMNTPGEGDGSITGWVNGTRYLNERGVRFRDDSSVGVDRILFSNFYGGHDDSWAAPADAEMHFDDLVVTALTD